MWGRRGAGRRRGRGRRRRGYGWTEEGVRAKKEVEAAPDRAVEAGFFVGAAADASHRANALPESAAPFIATHGLEERGLMGARVGQAPGRRLPIGSERVRLAQERVLLSSPAVRPLARLSRRLLPAMHAQPQAPAWCGKKVQAHSSGSGTSGCLRDAAAVRARPHGRQRERLAGAYVALCCVPLCGMGRAGARARSGGRTLPSDPPRGRGAGGGGGGAGGGRV